MAPADSCVATSSGGELLQFSISDIGEARKCSRRMREKIALWNTAVSTGADSKRLRSASKDQQLDTGIKARTTVAERLDSAADLRSRLLRTRVRRARNRVQHAKKVALVRREAQVELAESRLRLSKARLAAAAARREQRLAELAAAHARPGYLRANAMQIERLRQSLALLRMQRKWRTYTKRSRTTRALVDRFASTGMAGAFEESLRRETKQERSPNTAEPAPQTTPQILSAPGVGLGTAPVSQPWVRSFDALAEAMSDPQTLRSAQALLARLERLVHIMHRWSNPDCEMLVKRLFPRAASRGATLPRYPARIFLSAYMIQAHPEVMFTSSSEWEERLGATAEEMLRAFEAVAASYLEPAAADEASGTKRELLKVFDEAWVAYLELFVTWKGEDAASIEQDLIKIAVDMQGSMLAAVQHVSPDLTVESAAAGEGGPQLAAIVAQTRHDQALLRTRLERLRGPPAIERFEAAVAAAEPSVAARRVPSRSPSRSGSASERNSPRDSDGRRVSFSSPVVTSRNGEAVNGQGSWAIASAHGFQANAEDDSSLAASDSNEGQAELAVHSERVPPRGGAQAAPPQAQNPMPTPNEMMFHRLLFNPNWRIDDAHVAKHWAQVMESTGERVPVQRLNAAAASPDALNAHIRIIAQDALIDSALQALTSVPDDASADILNTAASAAISQMLTIVVSLAGEVFDSIPEAHPARGMRAEFEEATLHEAIEGAGTLPGKVQVVADLLGKTVQLLVQVGAPGRDAAATAATSRVSNLLMEALHSSDSASASHRAVSTILGRALRLLMAQLHMLKADAANGRLTMLTATLTQDQAVAYARGKFMARLDMADGTSEDAAALREKLPITARFSESSPSADHIASQVEALGEVSRNAPAAAPTRLQTGRAVGLAAAADAPQGSLLASPLMPQQTTCGSWRARFRCAVAALLLQGTQLSGNAALPEVLLPYGEMLEEAKGSFQKAIVTHACMRIAAHHWPALTGSPLTLSAASALRAHLDTIQADSSDALRSAAGLAITDAASAAASRDVDAQAVSESLAAALAPGSSALQASAAALLHVTQALAVRGPMAGLPGTPGDFDAPAAPPAWASTLVSEPAALCMHANIADVAHSIMRVCAVAEGVHEPQLSKLF